MLESKLWVAYEITTRSANIVKVVPVAVVNEKWRQTAVMEGEGTSRKGDTHPPLPSTKKI